MWIKLCQQKNHNKIQDLGDLNKQESFIPIFWLPFWLFCISINTLLLAKHSSRIHQQSILCFLLFGVVVDGKNCLSHFQTKSIIFCLFFTISPWFGHKSHLTWASVRPTSDKTSVFFFHAEVTSTKVRQKQNFMWSTTIPLNFYFMLCPNCNSFIMDLNCRN